MYEEIIALVTAAALIFVLWMLVMKSKDYARSKPASKEARTNSTSSPDEPQAPGIACPCDRRCSCSRSCPRGMDRRKTRRIEEMRQAILSVDENTAMTTTPGATLPPAQNHEYEGLIAAPMYGGVVASSTAYGDTEANSLDPLGNTAAILIEAKKYYESASPMGSPLMVHQDISLSPSARDRTLIHRGKFVMTPHDARRVSETEWDIGFSFEPMYDSDEMMWGWDQRRFKFTLAGDKPIVVSMGSRWSGYSMWEP